MSESDYEQLQWFRQQMAETEQQLSLPTPLEARQGLLDLWSFLLKAEAECSTQIENANRWLAQQCADQRSVIPLQSYRYTHTDTAPTEQDDRSTTANATSSSLRHKYDRDCMLWIGSFSSAMPATLDPQFIDVATSRWCPSLAFPSQNPPRASSSRSGLFLPTNDKRTTTDKRSAAATWSGRLNGGRHSSELSCWPAPMPKVNQEHPGTVFG